MTTTHDIPTLIVDTPFSLLEAQRDAILRQAAVYFDDDIPCDGLHAMRAYDAATWSDGTPIEDHGYPAGAVAVDFTYIYPSDDDEPMRFGLETTVYDQTGNVIDSQDFG